METLCIESSQGHGVLELSNRVYGKSQLRRRDLEAVTVALRDDGLAAQVKVYMYSPHGTVASFMAGLAKDALRWEGVRRWESIERQWTIDANHDRLGTVFLDMTLRPGLEEWCWTARVRICVDAGAQLERIARQMDGFLARSGDVS